MIIGDGIMLGAGGESASIQVTGVAQTDTVTCTKDGKSYNGKWMEIHKRVPTQVPIMTSSTTPSGVVSAHSAYNNYGDPECLPYLAFQGEPRSRLQAHSDTNDAQGWWLAYDFGYKVAIESFEISPQFNSSATFWDRLAKTFILQGSNDGEIWTDIQSYTRTTHLSQTSTDDHEILSFHVDTRAEFRMFRLYWSEVLNSAYACCSYLQFYGTKEEKTYGYVFPVANYGTYTITATDGTNTETQDVLVDSAYVFSVSINYIPANYLYWLGDTRENKTGGWTNDGYTFTTWGSEYTRFQATNTDEFMESSATKGYTLAGTVNAVDLTNYSKVVWEIDDVTAVAGGGYPPSWRLCASPEKSFSTSTETVTEIQVTEIGKHTYSIDVSDLSGLYFISFTNNSIYYSGRQLVGHILRVWLE